MELNFFTSEQLQWLGKIALITTVIVSAINQLQDTVKGKWIVAVVALVITVLLTTFTRGMHIADWQVLLTNMLLATSTAILFWTYLGQWTIDRLFGWIKKKMMEKFPTSGVDTPNEKP